MILSYINAAMERAHYEIIEDAEPFYGSIPGIQGVWATGVTLEACRKELADSLEDWLLFSVRQGADIPQSAPKGGRPGPPGTHSS